MKFDTAAPIGRGGMGEVFRAQDPDLDRPVAIKLLHRSDEESAARMLREARAQARLDHPNICKVYEVGELDGRPYIAMQLIEGKTLDEATVELSPERKAALLMTVAEAVHAAHRAGLIHRDLKPGNILVEEGEDGSLTPYVLDFGIARERDVEGFTVTGQVLGTPGFLSPEQARGETHSLDRRSDVFSLGAVLYHLLAGRAPFQAESSVATLVKLLQEEVPPLRKVAPNVPLDLATIAEKCLEKDPDRRYASARALAEDLGLFLEGEPIRARPVGLAYRAAKKIRKHPVVSALGTAALLAVVVFGAIALRTRLQAAEEQRLAQQFGQRVERMESLMRLGHMAPIHDIRTDRAEVEEEIERLVADTEERGRSARGPGNYAIGRGYLSLDLPDLARDHLDIAWESGYQTPAVALALGRSLGRLYSERLAAADQLADLELRRQQREQARLELGERAKELLGRGDLAVREGSEPEALYLRGLLDFYDGALEEARTRAEQAAAGRAWFHEPHLLAAEASVRLAIEALENGDHEVAAAEFARGQEAFLAAAARAPSDPRIYLGRCGLGIQEMKLAWDTAQSADSAYQDVVSSCQQALEVDPELTEAIDRQSEAAWSLARSVALRGDDPTELLDRATAEVDRSLELSASNHRAYGHRGNALWVRSKWLADQTLDPFPTFESAIESFEQGLELAPGNLHLLVSLGNALNDRAWQQSELTGEDPVPSWRAAEAAYEQAASLSERSSSRLLKGLCAVRNDTAYYLFNHGGDPGDLPARAIEACQAALEINPDSISALNGLGMANWDRANYSLARGADPGEAFEQGVAAFDRILEIDPGRPTTSVNLTNLLIDEATWRFEEGDDPVALLDRAESHNQAVENVYANDFHLLQSRLEMLRALAGVSKGLSPIEAFARAERHGRESVRVGRTNAALSQLTAVFRRRAEWRHAQEQTRPDQVAGDIDQGLQWAARTLDRDPKLAKALAHRAALEYLRAQLTEDDERAHWFEAAEASKARALELRPDLARDLSQVTTPSQL